MSRTALIRVAGAGLLFLLLCVSPAAAEVHVTLDGDGNFIELRGSGGSAGGPSPWAPTGQAEGGWLVLNADGALKGDGHPVVASHPGTGLPFVAWHSRTSAGDRDIMLATFDGREWVNLGTLGSMPGIEDRGPAIAFVPDGRLLIAWTSGLKDSSIWAAWWTPDGFSAMGRLTPPDLAAHSPAIKVIGGGVTVGSILRGRPGGIRYDDIPLHITAATDGPLPLPPQKAPGDSISGGIRR